MKILLFVLVILTNSLFTYAEKNQLPLKDCKWHNVAGTFSSVLEFREAVENTNSIVDIDSFVTTPNQPMILHTIIEAPSEQGNKLYFEMENKNPCPVFLIDGRPVNNLRQDASFTSEILFTEGNDLLLSIVIDNSSLISKIGFTSYVDRMYLSYINGISIVWCEPMKDPFFGGYMVEVHVLNLLQNDIDGKLKALITDTNTFDIIAENNNCAFTRNNSEAVIDINFPEAKDKLVNGKYMIEISLVDKEKNEEIVDKLIVPIWLN